MFLRLPNIASGEYMMESSPTTLGVIGLGYVGLPLAIGAGRAGVNVLGFDVDLTEVLPLELVTGETIDDVGFQLEEVIDVRPGDKLLISPVVTAESVETYQVFSFDLNTGEIPAINREESLRVEYIITGGGFFDGPPFGSMQFSSNGHFSTIWTLPNDRKKMEEDVIIAVIRDQRGGTTVSELTVRYVEDGDPEASAFGF